MKIAFASGMMWLLPFGMVRGGDPGPTTPHILVEARIVDITVGNAPLPAPLDRVRSAPGILGLLVEGQYRTVLRELGRRKGVEPLAGPRITTKDGMQACIEMMQPFVYRNEAGKSVSKEHGIALTALPRLTGDGRIDLELNPRMVDFHGFIEHASGWKEPVFHNRNQFAKVVMIPGCTVVLEMEPGNDGQTVGEKDKKGRMIGNAARDFTKRRLVFVTADLVDPLTGKVRASSPTRGTDNPQSPPHHQTPP